MLKYAVAALALASGVTASIDLDAVHTHAIRETAHPTICDASVRQTAGYFDIDAATDKHYFYWFFESRGNPETDPVVLWMTGGPGCSSEIALFFENGPCKVEPDISLSNNEYSWNTNANLLYIDQPAGTGFSYSDESGHDHNESDVARDMYIFLQDFFKANPQFQKNELFIFGESYGGHYVPSTANRVFLGNQNHDGLHLNLQGVGVGNGLTDPAIQYEYYPQMIYNYTKERLGHPVVDLATYEQMEAAKPHCISEIQKCQTSDQSCVDALGFCNNAMLTPYEDTGLNVYDIRKKCIGSLCYDMSAIDKFLTRNSTRAALGITNPKAIWSECNMKVNQEMAKFDWMHEFQNKLTPILEAGIPVLIYAGDCDYVCNWIGNKAWTLALDWSGKDAFNAAKDHSYNFNNKEVAIARHAANFTFLQVHDAGHMVPLDQPAVALDMLMNFMSGKPF